MRLGELATAAQGILSAKRVFGDPVERDGVVVIPAAVVFGGGGGGRDEGCDEGAALPVKQGAGIGLYARPAGAFVLRGGTVAWVPAVDLTRLGAMAGGVVVALAWLLTRVARKS